MEHGPTSSDNSGRETSDQREEGSGREPKANQRGVGVLHGDGAQVVAMCRERANGAGAGAAEKRGVLHLSGGSQ